MTVLPLDMQEMHMFLFWQAWHHLNGGTFGKSNALISGLVWYFMHGYKSIILVMMESF
jgi:hypothetical protein